MVGPQTRTRPNSTFKLRWRRRSDRGSIPAMVLTGALPARDVMLRAFFERDSSFEGVFITGVRTTGIFCRPTCAARKPLSDHVEFFATAREALLAGYRPCKRCRPMGTPGDSPGWLKPLMDQVEADPSRRWSDGDLRAAGLSPSRVRRWFVAHHGMTFHAYGRARRLGLALGRIREGDRVTGAAFDSGWESLGGFHEAFRKLFGSAPRSTAGQATVVTVNRVLTPLGPMIAGATEEALCLLEFVDRRMLQTQLRVLRERLGCVFVPGDNPLIAATARGLGEWFQGRVRAVDVPLALPGTAFQRAVWERLRTIPYGTTVTYGELASALGSPSAVRAVARANGGNRIAILVPCHRVIGADGRMTGYGGGLWRKRRLLEIEGVALETNERTGPGEQAGHPTGTASRGLGS